MSARLDAPYRQEGRIVAFGWETTCAVTCTVTCGDSTADLIGRYSPTFGSSPIRMGMISRGKSPRMRLTEEQNSPELGEKWRTRAPLARRGGRLASEETGRLLRSCGRRACRGSRPSPARVTSSAAWPGHRLRLLLAALRGLGGLRLGTRGCRMVRLVTTVRHSSHPLSFGIEECAGPAVVFPQGITRPQE